VNASPHLGFTRAIVEAICSCHLALGVGSPDNAIVGWTTGKVLNADGP
jgi:hypothetical protein